MTAAVALILTLLTIWLLARPHVAPLRRGIPAETSDRLRALHDRKERGLQSLNDLELDRMTGKLPEDDYRKMKRSLMGEMAETLQLIDDVNATEDNAG